VNALFIGLETALPVLKLMLFCCEFGGGRMNGYEIKSWSCLVSILKDAKTTGVL
jgi:hypothetical protein